MGTVVNSGKWTVDIPSGAFTGAASISVGTSAREPLTCELGIAPLEKNNFSKPVMLTAHLLPGTMSNTTRIEWYNPQTKMWEPVPGSTLDPVHNTVSAPLWHFSTYRVGGRSGW